MDDVCEPVAGVCPPRRKAFFLFPFPCGKGSGVRFLALIATPQFPLSARYCGRQLIPPSDVANRRPLAVVIVASLALLADTAARFSAAGGVINVQCSPPSVVRMIVPLRPTIQHTFGDAALPATRSVVTPLCCVRIAPFASRRWTVPFLPTIQVTA